MSDVICIQTLCLLLRAVLLTELELRALKKSLGECGEGFRECGGRGVWGGGYYAFCD